MQAKLNMLMRKLHKDNRGLSTVEYVVLLVLIVAIAVALWNVFGNLLVGKLASAATEFDNKVVTSSNGAKDTENAAAKAGQDIETFNYKSGGGGGGGGGQ